MIPLLKRFTDRIRGGGPDRRAARRAVRNECETYRRWAERRPDDRYHT